MLYSLVCCCNDRQPANLHIMRQLRNAPPSNVGKTKSDKASSLTIYTRRASVGQLDNCVTPLEPNK